MTEHKELANFIWDIADLLRGPYRKPQYERVMLPMTVLRRFDCDLEETKPQVLTAYKKYKDKRDYTIYNNEAFCFIFIFCNIISN